MVTDGHRHGHKAAGYIGSIPTKQKEMKACIPLASYCFQPVYLALVVLLPTRCIFLPTFKINPTMKIPRRHSLESVYLDLLEMTVSINGTVPSLAFFLASQGLCLTPRFFF